MDTLEGGKQIAAESESFPSVEGTPFETLAKRLALDQVHHIIGEPVLLIGVVDGDHVRVGKRGQRAGFPEEPGLARGGRHLRPEHLDGHDATEGSIEGAVDRGHAAGGDLGLDFVARRQGIAQPLEKGWH